MTSILQKLLDQEMEKRNELKAKINALIDERYEVRQLGSYRRGTVQKYLYAALGYVGYPGHFFENYVNQIMVERGHRLTYSNSFRVYSNMGLKKNIVD